jgi:hypothetical protein
MEECNGRPHWAKKFSQKKDYMTRVYSKFNDFNQLRQRMDPENLFINEYYEPIFL